MSVPQDTDRLQLRQAQVEDAPFMLKLLTEPAWRKFISQHEVKCEASALRYMEERIFPPYREALGFWVVVFGTRSSRLVFVAWSSGLIWRNMISALLFWKKYGAPASPKKRRCLA